MNFLIGNIEPNNPNEPDFAKGTQMAMTQTLTLITFLKWMINPKMMPQKKPIGCYTGC
jgi:hypothetical protein